MRVMIWWIGPCCSLMACRPDLQWTEPKTYTPPPAATLYVDGLGIDDSVSIMSADTFSVSHRITNAGRAGIQTPYTALDSLVRWIFQGGPTVGYSWVPGPAATHTVGVLAASGLPLPAGRTAPLAFPLVADLPCGLYRETLVLDSGGTVAETNEANNVDPKNHFFFVPSNQDFTISVAEINGAIGHDAAANTHTFTINSAGAPGWVFAGFSFVATEGSQAVTDPAPPAVGGPGPQIITMRVEPQRHNFTGGGTVTGKITVISADGCVLRQMTARVFVEHT